MSPDALTVEIRARTHWEAVDLGLALIQTYWRNLYAAWFVVLLPVAFSALALSYLLVLNGGNKYDIQVSVLLVWWLKPFYDRVILHVLSRAVFGETVTWRDVLRAMPHLLRHSGLFRALTWRRFTPIRSFVLPIWQLEGVTGEARRRRFSVLKKNGNGAIRLFFTCGIFEMILLFGALGLLFMMLPPELLSSRLNTFFDIFTADETPFWFEATYCLVYLLILSVVEPFYAAAGFTLYLNRRTELEGWDIELGFRTLATRLEAQQASP